MFRTVKRFLKYKVISAFSDLYWGIAHRTFDKYHIIKTDLKPGYYDINIRMVSALYALVKDFVEIEMTQKKGKEAIVYLEERIKNNFQSQINKHDEIKEDDFSYNHSDFCRCLEDDSEVCLEILPIYRWIVIENPEMQIKIKKLEEDGKYEEAFNVELEHSRIENTMLHKIINNRNIMWT